MSVSILYMGGPLFSGMAWLPDGEKILKICLCVSTQFTNVMDRHTHRHRKTAKAAFDASITRQKPLYLQTITEQPHEIIEQGHCADEM